MGFPFGIAGLVASLSLASHVLPANQRGADELPEPWRHIPSLNSTQAEALHRVLSKFEADEARCYEITYARRRQLLESQELYSEKLCGCETRLWMTSRVNSRRISRHLAVVALLTPTQQVALDDLWYETEQTSSLPNFAEHTAKQQEQVWCWAACLQAALSYSCIELSQEDIVEEIKGALVWETAEAYEIANGISGFRFSAEHTGRTWSGDCRYKEGLAPAPLLVGYMRHGRVLMLGLNNRHVVVLHKIEYHGPPAEGDPNRLQISSITYFDPLSGCNKNLSWKDAQEVVTGTWTIIARKSTTRTFKRP